MRKLTLMIGLFILSYNCFGQEFSLKEQALEEFKNENYSKSIELLKQAEKENPNDAEIYYYLGFFSHYLAYDSRPLEGYNHSWSEQIFKYFNKALELKPDYGDAKYFYGAECSANAFLAMQRYDAEKLKIYYKKAYEKGAYPLWLLEFGKNLLNSCDKNAILFTGGNADFDVCMYLQLHENFRNDITIIPIGNIGRPWMVKFYKDGLDETVKPISINLTDEQIMDIHPYKWKSVTLKIPLIEQIKKQYDLSSDYMEWVIDPDFTSTREHSKIKGEKSYKRTYLSPQHAILSHIIEANEWIRSIYFSKTCNTYFMAGLEEYTQESVLALKLLPFKTENSNYWIDVKKYGEIIINEQTIKDYKTILNEDIPRISSAVVFLYWHALYKLAQYYLQKEDKEMIDIITDFAENNLAIGFKEETEKYYLEEIKKMK